MRRILLSLALVLLMVGTVVGCARPAPSITPTPTSASPKTLDIAIITPLTGPGAWLGTNIQNGVLLAIDDQNNEGGVTIAGQKYVLNGIVRDSKLDVVVGKNTAEEMVYDKGVKVIAGPFIGDAVGVQSVSEKSKVISFAVSPGVPGLCSINKPYSFFPGGLPLMCAINPAAYIQQFYPQAKTVLTMTTDSPSLQVWVEAAQTVCQLYGFDWLGVEKFPIDTKDFMPYVTRVLSKHPDVIDMGGTGGDMGATSALLIKQLREAGFDGLISAPALPPPPVVMEVVPERYRPKLITNDIVVDSPIVSQAYKDMHNRYVNKFGDSPIDIVGEFYNGVKPFFKFLDGQDTMDTTAWMNGFEEYRWENLFGHEGYWVGKPMFGINRVLLRNFWASEWIDGKPETRWEVPIPYDLFVAE